MSKKNSRAQVIKKRLLSIAIKIALFNLFLLIATFITISIPAVQTKIINKISDAVFLKIEHKLNIEYINIRWFDTVLIKGLLVYDTQHKKMIKADRIILDFKLSSLITRESVNLDKIILQGANVAMLKNAPDGQFNLNFFIDEIKNKLIKKKSKKDSKIFNTDKVILTNGKFKIYRDDKDPITHRFDQYHFTLMNIEANLRSFIIKPGNIAFAINNLQCIDSATGLDIKKLETKFLYTRQSMVFQHMDMKFGNSSITQSMIFDYKQPSSVKEFVDSVKITANVKKSIIYSKDIGHFAPALKKYSEYYRIKGFVEGPVNRFNVKNLTINFGKKSEVKGYFGIYGLPNFEESFINAKINTAHFHLDDITPYISENSYNNMKKFGVVKFNGRFSGFPGDFVSNASFNTHIGHIDTDINLKIGKNINEKSTYSGRLATKNFNLGILLSDTAAYQYIDMDGSINGSGFTKENAKFDLLSSISRVGLNGYDYHNIKTDALMAEQFFSGNLIIDDPNLQFNGKASIDLNQENEIIQIEAKLGKANLDKLKITKEPAFLSSTLKLDMKGLSLDEILGDIFLDSTHFRYGEKEIFIDRLSVLSQKDSLSRTLTVRSPNADLNIFGDFNYTSFFQDIINVYDEYKLIFRNNSKEINAYYSSQKKGNNEYYYLDYDINLKEINPIVNLFIPNFFLSKNTKITGGFTGGNTKLVELSSLVDTLTIDGYTFEKNNINFQTQKSSDTTLVYAKYQIESESQKINNKQSSENLSCNIDWDGNEIEFAIDIDQSNSSNYVKTTGLIQFLPDITNISLNNSEISFIDKLWEISSDNLLTIRTKDYTIKNLSINHGDQKIKFNGKLSEDPSESLFITIKNFDMKNLNPILTKRIDGKFSGFIALKNYFDRKEINSQIKISDFSVNEFLVGSILASSDFDNIKNLFDLDLKVFRGEEQTMKINGYFNPSNKKEQLSLNATFINTNMNLIEPFFEEYISNVNGKLNGNVLITGSLSEPTVKGIGNTSNGEFTLDYLNTHYKLNGEVVFNNNYIDFNNFKLIDKKNNEGDIWGRITHSGFKELEFDFYGELKNFLVLNTTSKNNSLYYGTAYATGDLRIYGKEKVINISANATSEKGTKFYIPLEGSSEVVKEDFINFISINDTIHHDAHERGTKMDLAGVNLNLELDITPDAYVEIIFDLTAGDIIRGRGNGKLNLQIDTKGDFNMFGDYEITEGGYNFTLYNIINKEFEVEPNSRISWIGDPYEAILDIKANYRQLASLAPILRVTPKEIQDNPELNRKYPAKVLLGIKGNLMYPQIEFDVDVEDYPKNATYNDVSIETRMTAFKNLLATDEQELKRQVFSLIILKKFSAENAFKVGGGSVESVGRSVSEFISNQISYWVTQFDENLVVDVDLGSLDEEAFNTFQLRMSYSFLDGRLRVTRDGGFTDQTSGTNVASILGDWSVEYLLSPDGKLRAKIYNKTNYNNLNQNLKSTSTTAGFSLSHTESFDEIKNIFKKSREKNRSKKIDASSEEGISTSKNSTNKL